jgi:hypothetical protein
MENGILKQAAKACNVFQMSKVFIIIAVYLENIREKLKPTLFSKIARTIKQT